jgi:hypothetical protein
MKMRPRLSAAITVVIAIAFCAVGAAAQEVDPNQVAVEQTTASQPVPTQESDPVKDWVNNIYYYPLAAAARVEGDVQLLIIQAEGQSPQVGIVSGPPLLAQSVANYVLRTKYPFAPGEKRLIFHFRLISPLSRQIKIPIGSKKSRFFRRMVRAKLTQTIETCETDPNVGRHNEYKLDDDVVDISITKPSPCLQTESAKVNLVRL